MDATQRNVVLPTPERNVSLCDRTEEDGLADGESPRRARAAPAGDLMRRVLATVRSFLASIVAAALLPAPAFADPLPGLPHIGVLADGQGDVQRSLLVRADRVIRW